jgi:hypothetical protein
LTIPQQATGFCHTKFDVLSFDLRAVARVVLLISIADLEELLCRCGLMATALLWTSRKTFRRAYTVSFFL